MIGLAHFSIGSPGSPQYFFCRIPVALIFELQRNEPQSAGIDPFGFSEAG
jgi:hypothetical protein